MVAGRQNAPPPSFLLHPSSNRVAAMHPAPVPFATTAKCLTTHRDIARCIRELSYIGTADPTT